VEFDIKNVAFDDSLDLFGAVRIFEGVEGVLIGGEGRGYVGDHHCTAVATQTVLKQAGQLGVTIGDVLVLPTALGDTVLGQLAQGVDTVSQGQQRFVNIGALNKSEAPVVRVGGTLTARQINQR
jgi:hypothetical protein